LVFIAFCRVLEVVYNKFDVIIGSYEPVGVNIKFDYIELSCCIGIDIPSYYLLR
jgi:hypothetical protein